MTELDLIGGLSDIEEQLREGNANHAALAARIGELAKALANLPAPKVTVVAPDVNVAPTRVDVAAPDVHVPITVMPAPLATYDWEHHHYYDELGRLVKTVSLRVNRKEK